MSDYGNVDLYRTPRYTPGVAQALSESATSTMWDDWDLAGLLVETPHQFAAKMGCKFGIFCSTGTAGLHASLMALELLPGDEVVVPCMTFIRAVTPLVHLGLVPVLADVDPATGNLDPESLKRVIGAKTRAVIVVHMWGICADMDAIASICRDHNLLLIEDFSHAHFSQHSSGLAGSFGSVSFASMQRKKTLAVGEGGLIVTSDQSVYERLRAVTSPGSFKGTSNYNEFSGFGLNLRMSPFSAVVARSLLDQCDEIVKSRSLHAKTFDRLILEQSEYLSPPKVPSYALAVSAYGYKPSFTDRIGLDKLMEGNSAGLWKFGRFSYDHILASPFWRKSRAHFPFCQQIYPRTPVDFPGYLTYSRNRISLSVPTVGSDYWTDENVEKWRVALQKTVSE